MHLPCCVAVCNGSGLCYWYAFFSHEIHRLIISNLPVDSDREITSH